MLDRSNATSKNLYDPQIDLSFIIQIHGSVGFFFKINDFRNIKIKPKHYLESMIIIVKTCRRKIRKLQQDESHVNLRAPVSGQENFRTNIYYPILDQTNTLVDKYPNDV